MLFKGFGAGQRNKLSARQAQELLAGKSVLYKGFITKAGKKTDIEIALDAADPGKLAFKFKEKG